MSGWASPYGSWTPTAPPPHVSTSATELKHLGIAFLVLTFDLTIVITRFNPFANVPVGGSAFWLEAVAVGATIAFLGFVAHELAHKISAQRRGFWAEFRMSPTWLVISVITSLLGFLIAAPGATVIGGMGDVRSWGRTSLAGPLLNLAAGGAFLAVAFGTWEAAGSVVLWRVFVFLGFFMGWFAAFNLIPFGPLDGRKVWRWSPGSWVSTMGVALLLVGFTYYAMSFLAFGPRF